LIHYTSLSGGQEIEFQEIETGGQKYYKIFRRSKVSFCKIVQEIEKSLGALKGLVILWVRLEVKLAKKIQNNDPLGLFDLLNNYAIFYQNFRSQEKRQFRSPVIRSLDHFRFPTSFKQA
jgi:hypothetical protein